MKKKISILGLALILVLGFTGCGSKSADSSDYDKTALSEQADFIIESFSGMTEESVEAFAEMSDMEANLTVLMNWGMRTEPDDFMAMMEAWLAGQDECGTYVSHGDFEMETSNEGVTLSAPAEFEDRDGTIEFAFDEDGNMESLTVSAKYSMGEILEKAGLNTILGMGTVFVVLIFISFIISLFKFIPAIEKKFKKQAKTEPVKPAPKPAAPAAPVAVAEPEPDLGDEELAAVIAAAVAASEEVSPEGFIVRSIKRRKTNKWN